MTLAAGAAFENGCRPPPRAGEPHEIFDCLGLSLVFFVPLRALGANLGLIEGTVREYSGEPTAQGKVTLFARSDRKVDERTTDAQGHFAFVQVPFGQYQVQVTLADGRTNS